MKKRKRRGIQEINAGSMADIAFLLLVFFLVATQIKSDIGIVRKLPPIVEDADPPPPIRERNVFVVLVNSQDQLLVENEYGKVSTLREQVKEFITNPKDNVNLSERKPEEEIDLIGPYVGSKGVVSLQNDRNTSYDIYIQVQDEVTAAFNELRDDLSNKKFGKPHDKDLLTKDQYNAIRKAIPMAISEAEPRNTGG